MTFKLFDAVAAVADLPHGVRAGVLGTVIELYADGSMDVDFEPDQDENLRVVAVTPEQVCLAQQAQTA
ncbi:MAG: DUF4926 domain-containing protein [Burkholderiales bacterium]|nr:DUF4926 domain-containing protein [Burkholderiales bacterium]